MWSHATEFSAEIRGRLNIETNVPSNPYLIASPIFSSFPTILQRPVGGDRRCLSLDQLSAYDGLTQQLGMLEPSVNEERRGLDQKMGAWGCDVPCYWSVEWRAQSEGRGFIKASDRDIAHPHLTILVTRDESQHVTLTKLCQFVCVRKETRLNLASKWKLRPTQQMVEIDSYFMSCKPV